MTQFICFRIWPAFHPPFPFEKFEALDDKEFQAQLAEYGREQLRLHKDDVRRERRKRKKKAWDDNKRRYGMTIPRPSGFSQRLSPDEIRKLKTKVRDTFRGVKRDYPLVCKVGHLLGWWKAGAGRADTTQDGRPASDLYCVAYIGGPNELINGELALAEVRDHFERLSDIANWEESIRIHQYYPSRFFRLDGTSLDAVRCGRLQLSCRRLLEEAGTAVPDVRIARLIAKEAWAAVLTPLFKNLLPPTESTDDDRRTPPVAPVEDDPRRDYAADNGVPEAFVTGSNSDDWRRSANEWLESRARLFADWVEWSNGEWQGVSFAKLTDFDDSDIAAANESKKAFATLRGVSVDDIQPPRSPIVAEADHQPDDGPPTLSHRIFLLGLRDGSRNDKEALKLIIELCGSERVDDCADWLYGFLDRPKVLKPAEINAVDFAAILPALRNEVRKQASPAASESSVNGQSRRSVDPLTPAGLAAFSALADRLLESLKRLSIPGFGHQHIQTVAAVLGEIEELHRPDGAKPRKLGSREHIPERADGVSVESLVAVQTFQGIVDDILRGLHLTVLCWSPYDPACGNSITPEPGDAERWQAFAAAPGLIESLKHAVGDLRKGVPEPREPASAPEPKPTPDESATQKSAAPSTRKGLAQERLAYHLCEHHRFDGDSIAPDVEPISSNELRRRAGGVGSSAAVKFFAKWFGDGGYESYRIKCQRPGDLALVFKLLTGDTAFLLARLDERKYSDDE